MKKQSHRLSFSTTNNDVILSETKHLLLFLTLAAEGEGGVEPKPTSPGK